MKHALIAALLLLTACVSADDYLVKCGQNQACAEAAATEENNRRATLVALGLGAVLLGAAAGAAAGAATAPSYQPAPVYRAPVSCQSNRIGSQVFTNCY